MSNEFDRAMREGFADAIGFVGGALAGWGLGRLFGIDFIASSDWNAPQILGLVLIVAGCGVGRWLARRFIVRDRA